MKKQTIRITMIIILVLFLIIIGSLIIIKRKSISNNNEKDLINTIWISEKIEFYEDSTLATTDESELVNLELQDNLKICLENETSCEEVNYAKRDEKIYINKSKLLNCENIEINIEDEKLILTGKLPDNRIVKYYFIKPAG